VEFVEIHPILTQEDYNIEDMIALPVHHRCASHTLNLIMSTDASKYMDWDFTSDKDKKSCAIKIPGKFSKISNEVFQKCRSLWNFQSRATKSADFIKEKLGILILYR